MEGCVTFQTGPITLLRSAVGRSLAFETIINKDGPLL